MNSLALCFVFAYLLAPSIGVTVGTSNNFIYPSNNDGNRAHIEGVFPIGSNITLNWTSMWESVNLVIFQDGNDTIEYLPNSVGLANADHFIWEVNLSGTGGNPDFKLTNGHTFLFGVYQTGTDTVFRSQFINITDSGTSSMVSSTSSVPHIMSTSSSSLLTVPSTRTSSQLPTSSASTSPKPDASRGLKPGAKIGIGVSLGVVGLVLVLGTGFFFYKRSSIPRYIPSPVQTAGNRNPAELPDQAVNSGLISPM